MLLFRRAEGGTSGKPLKKKTTQVQFVQMCRLCCHRLVTERTSQLTPWSFVDIVCKPSTHKKKKKSLNNTAVVNKRKLNLCQCFFLLNG